MTTTKTSLARLERVEVRDIWPKEAQDFTPWLAEDENLQLLGETLGIDLENAGTEVSVGAFSADILAIDTLSRSKVLIENQLESTDHSHLGQILTYAAGLDAPTVVWIAREFTDEHRAALEWLNSHTPANIRFFGLEVEVWRIGDSARAPKFNIVAKPNNWTKSATPGPALTPTKRAQQDYWRGFAAYASDHAVHVRPTAPPAENWMGLAVGRGGYQLRAIVSSGSGGKPEIRAEFVIFGGDPAERFDALTQERDKIHSEFGENLEWHSPEGAVQRKIYVRLRIEWRDEDQHQECHAWLVEKLDRLHKVFHDRIKKIP